MTVLALDLDGTLLDCRERQVALARALAPGIDPDRFWGAKLDGATTRAALAAEGVADPEGAAAAWIAQVEDERWLELDRLLPAARPAIEAARSAGFAPVLVTARRDAGAVRRQVERLGLAALVDELVVVDPARAADEKAAVLRARRAGGLAGDTESDARAAALASVPFAAVAGGQRSEAFLRARGIAVVHADALAAVRALVAGDDPPDGR